jgi:hypothetical protein
MPLSDESVRIATVWDQSRLPELTDFQVDIRTFRNAQRGPLSVSGRGKHLEIETLSLT